MPAPIRSSAAVRAGSVVDTFELRDGTSLSIPRRADETESRLGAGTKPNLFITLNQTDQRALASGAAAALAVALCAIPAVGWASCALITGALAAGLVYVHTHGICPSSRPILKTFVRTGVTGCVKS